jgi:hypothetical protein
MERDRRGKRPFDEMSDAPGGGAIKTFDRSWTVSKRSIGDSNGSAIERSREEGTWTGDHWSAGIGKGGPSSTAELAGARFRWSSSSCSRPCPWGAGGTGQIYSRRIHSV